MVNPNVMFPYVTRSPEGLVYAGIVACDHHTYMVVAVCPTSRRRPAWKSGLTHEAAVDVATNHVAGWYDHPRQRAPRAVA